MFYLEKVGASCTNHLCGSGKCFAINDPSLLYVCLCPNGQLAPSCKSHEIRLTTGRMLISAPQPLESCDSLKPNSCKNGGQCLPNIDGYQCLCTSGFTGKFCQISRLLRLEIVWIDISIQKPMPVFPILVSQSNEEFSDGNACLIRFTWWCLL